MKTSLTNRQQELLDILPAYRSDVTEDMGITGSTLDDHLSAIRNAGQQIIYVDGIYYEVDVDPDENELDINPDRTPPAPETLKNKLYFDRAEQCCEWCEMWIDQPEVHHIDPRSQGGPNTMRNLIVLCPNCHTKADRGAISRSKLKAKVKRKLKNDD